MQLVWRGAGRGIIHCTNCTEDLQEFETLTFQAVDRPLTLFCCVELLLFVPKCIPWKYSVEVLNNEVLPRFLKGHQRVQVSSRSLVQ